MHSKFIPTARFAVTLAITLGFSTAVSTSALAASATWSVTPTDGVWDVTSQTNWSTGAATFPGSTSSLTNTDTATFSGTSTTTAITINSTTLNVGSITFGNAAAGDASYTIGSNGGNPLLLSSGGTILNNALTPATAKIVTYTVAAPLVIENSSGTGTGNGIYSLNASGGSTSATQNTFLQITGTVTGSASTGNNTTLTLTGNNNIRALNTSAINAISGVISDGTNGGTLSLALTTPAGNNSTTWLISGANTYTGGTTLTRAGTSSPTLRVANNSALGTGTVTFNGLSSLQSGAANLTLANNIVASAGQTANLGTNGNTMTLSGVISGNNLQKNDTGTLILSGANTYTGTTLIGNGSLSVSSLNSVSGGSASSGLGAPITIANGTISIGGGTTGASLIYTGSGETTDRVVNLASTTGGVTIDQSGTGLLKFTSATTATGAGIKTLTLQGSTAGTGEIGGAIVDNSGTNKTSVTKTGTGTWTLSGTNTYTGTTTVTTGILKAGNVAALGTSAVTLGTSGTLDLNGNAVTNAFNSNVTRGTLTNTGAAANIAATTITNNGSFMVTGTGNITLGTITGTAGNALVKNGANTLTLAGSADNAFLLVTVNAGTVELGKSVAGQAANRLVQTGGTVLLTGSTGNQISDGSVISLGGGTFDLNNQSETVGVLTLTTGAETFNFGSTPGANSFTFADSSAATWSGSLTLLNFEVGTDSLRFGTSSSGLTSGQYSVISLSGYTVTGLDATGFVQFAAVPEPHEIGLAMVGLLGIVIITRRRLAAR